MTSLALCLLSLFVLTADYGIPFFTSLQEQKAMVQRQDLRFRTLTSQAFLQVWGPPQLNMNIGNGPSFSGFVRKRHSTLSRPARGSASRMGHGNGGGGWVFPGVSGSA